MPDLRLYTTDTDDLRVVSWALAQDCVIVPDLQYTFNKYHIVKSAADYQTFRAQTRSFYLLSDSFFRCPLELRRVRRDDSAFYYIYPRSGGPTMRFLAGGTFEENGVQFIRPGELGYYPTYENTLEKKFERPPRQLVATYRSLKRSITQASTRIELGKLHQAFWLGKDAERVLRNGARLVGFEDYHLSAHR